MQKLCSSAWEACPAGIQSVCNCFSRYSLNGMAVNFSWLSVRHSSHTWKCIHTHYTRLLLILLSYFQSAKKKRKKKPNQEMLYWFLWPCEKRKGKGKKEKRGREKEAACSKIMQHRAQGNDGFPSTLPWSLWVWKPDTCGNQISFMDGNFAGVSPA